MKLKTQIDDDRGEAIEVTVDYIVLGDDTIEIQGVYDIDDEDVSDSLTDEQFEDLEMQCREWEDSK